jgi:hypothetical protein
MSLTPQNPVGQLEQVPAPVYRWYHKVSALLTVVFCLEIGVILLVLPWSEYWDNNFFSNALPALGRFWSNSYFRGAVSGLGVVNVLISFGELVRMRRFSRRA